MNLKYYSADGTGGDEREFAGFPVFEGSKGRMALRQAIIAVQANLRQGNASTKTRGEVSGSGKKMFRQKGTGMARRGPKRTPLLRGGGVAFGPKPRSYSQKVNRKMRRLALARALFEQGQSGSINVIEKWEAAEVKTKPFDALVSKIQPNRRVLIVDDEISTNVALSGRNIARLHFAETSNVNAYDIVRFDTIIFSERAIDTLLARVNGGES
ncbi:50S ribosomal protein L4 [Puniceicoccus vermicola]|uniref:Large ribosomal subunit protein uL4 n=1 Tax=Puniceicoccus vermicola TaxID=388746 RepID=A0A7X1E5L6_9BACT|nr:50S ribosomal protein L4 [Puniceicoccus vermicola]MBC2603274.1 50S ribosomal protein L4 [Puniceicoccus vermicola]